MSGNFQLGNSLAGMLDVARLVNASTLPICVTVAPLNELGDSSGPLFCMYLKMKEKDDNKRAERQQKDADGIILFVSPHYAPLST